MNHPTLWSDIAPADATDIDCTTRPDLSPPVNESGEVCPWPWEPQQLRGAPMGQYHCSYCGAMVIAGIPHPDYREYPELNESQRIAEIFAEARHDYEEHGGP